MSGWTFGGGGGRIMWGIGRIRLWLIEWGVDVVWAVEK